MADRPVHWHEGMFLQPQHFQTAARYFTEATQRSAKWATHHNWGLRTVDLDLDALTNSRFVVRSLQACFRDGTPIAVPEDGVLAALDLKGVFQPGQPVTIFVAMPVLNLGRSNVSENGSDPTARFRLDTLDLEDENTGVNPQPVQVRIPNFRLLLSGQDQTGYDVLPIARVEKSALANAPPQLDASFIPPILACDTWPILKVEILRSIFDRIGRKRERLVSQLTSRGVGWDSSTGAEAAMIAQLRELNEGYGSLSALAFSPGVPPLAAYVELCRLVGQLSIFDRTGKWPAIPAYDHDDLGGCFWRVKKYIDALLDIFPEPDYMERPFIGVGTRMQVAVEPTWLDPNWKFWIGVQSTLDTAECLRLLTVPGQLDMKVGSGERVDAIFQLGQQGLRFEPCPRPTILPDLPGQQYFQMGRVPEKEWGFVQKSLSFALRVNETRIVGGIQNQRTISIRTGSQTAPLQFTLYAAPQG